MTPLYEHILKTVLDELQANDRYPTRMDRANEESWMSLNLWLGLEHGT